MIDIDSTERLGAAAKRIDTDECHRIADRLDGVADDYPCVAAAQALLRFIAEQAEAFRPVTADVPALCRRVRELEAQLAKARDAIDGACTSSDYAAVRRALGVEP